MHNKTGSDKQWVAQRGAPTEVRRPDEDLNRLWTSPAKVPNGNGQRPERTMTTKERSRAPGRVGGPPHLTPELRLNLWGFMRLVLTAVAVVLGAVLISGCVHVSPLWPLKVEAAPGPQEA